MAMKYPQIQALSLYSSGASIGDTSVTLSSLKTIDAVALTMTDFGSVGYMTIDPGSGVYEEQISFTGITQNANGTATLTGVKTVLCLSPYTETSGLAKQHSGGAMCVVAVTSGFLDKFANKTNDETVTGTWTFTSTATARYNSHPTFAADTEIIDKKYVDDAVVAGAPDASETTKGLVQLATNAQMGTGTSLGSTGARLIPPNDQLVKTSSGAGDENKIPVLDATGTLANGFVDKARTWGTVQSFTANNAQITTDADSANDAVRYSLLQSSTSTNEATGTSGEALAIGDAVYLKASDGKLYKTDADADESTFSFVGFNLTTAGAADVAVRYAKPSGIATGLSGLTAGSKYFLSGTAGAISTTPNAVRCARVGLALSTTTLLVLPPKFRKTISQAVSWGSLAANVANITVGFYPVRLRFTSNNCGPGNWDFSGANDCTWSNNGVWTPDQTYVWKYYQGAGPIVTSYAVANVTGTKFDLNYTNTGSPGGGGNTTLTIIAESD